MMEIVGHPGGEELAQSDGTELRMTAGAIEIGLVQLQSFEAEQVLSAKLSERVEQLR
jgi:hypothetical protein